METFLMLLALSEGNPPVTSHNLSWLVAIKFNIWISRAMVLIMKKGMDLNFNEKELNYLQENRRKYK